METEVHPDPLCQQLVNDDCSQKEHKQHHKCEVVELNLRKLEGSDNLSICDIDGWVCVTNTKGWGEVPPKYAVFIPPDSVVDTKVAQFAFLVGDAKADGTYRIRARKIRGVKSFGLLVEVPVGDYKLGDDVAEVLGVKHYDPDMESSGKSGNKLNFGGDTENAPNVYHVKYDLEAGRRYAKTVFNEEELVVVLEKIHGMNSKFVYTNNRMYCGSRTQWKREFADYSHLTPEKLVEQSEGKLTSEKAVEIIEKLKSKSSKKNALWSILDTTPQLENFCKANPDHIVYGEVFGSVQYLKYGVKDGEVRFAAFDIMYNGKWLNAVDFYNICWVWNIPHVPILAGLGWTKVSDEPQYVHSITGVPFNFDEVCGLAEGKTTVPGADHCREGCVVRPITERRNEKLGRVHMKWVGCEFLSMKGAEYI